MQQIMTWLSGRKTYIISALGFVYAITAVTNGWGEAEINATIALIAGIGASTRAGINKVAPALLLSCVLCVGCAGLGQKGPDGTTPADNIVAGAVEIATGLPAPWNTAIPAATAGLLSILIGFGKAKDTPTAAKSKH